MGTRKIHLSELSATDRLENQIRPHYVSIGYIVIAKDKRKEQLCMPLEELLGQIGIPSGAEFFSRYEVVPNKEFYKNGRKVVAKKAIPCIEIEFYKMHRPSEAHNDKAKQFRELQAQVLAAVQSAMLNLSPDVSDSDSDRYAAGISNAD